MLLRFELKHNYDIVKQGISFSRHLFAIVLLFAVVPVWAQTPAAITFEEALSSAIDRNAALRTSRASLAAAEHRRRAAYAGFLPQLSATVGYSDTTADTSLGLSDGS